MAKTNTGRCAYRTDTFEFDTNPNFIGVCRCVESKKASGSEAAPWFCVPENDFNLISGVTRSYVADSGKRRKGIYARDAVRAYSRVTWKSFCQLVFVQFGSHDRPELIAPELGIFMRRRPKFCLAEFSDMPTYSDLARYDFANRRETA